MWHQTLALCTLSQCLIVFLVGVPLSLEIDRGSGCKPILLVIIPLLVLGMWMHHPFHMHPCAALRKSNVTCMAALSDPPPPHTLYCPGDSGEFGGKCPHQTGLGGRARAEAPVRNQIQDPLAVAADAFVIFAQLQFLPGLQSTCVEQGYTPAHTCVCCVWLLPTDLRVGLGQGVVSVGGGGGGGGQGIA